MSTDYISKDLSNLLLQYLESDQIPWVFSLDGVKDINTSEFYDSPQFTHTIVEGDYVGNIHPLIHNLWKAMYSAHPEAFENFTHLSRIKCNMITRGADSTPHVPHYDRYTPHTVIVYYVNDSDGITRIYDGDNCIEVVPEHGKYIIFNGALKHCGSSPLTHNHRIVINFNF